MMVRKLSVLVLGVMMVFALYAVQADHHQKGEADMSGEKMHKHAKIGEAAPDFTLMSAAGEEHSLSDFAGKYVILEWINFDCPFVEAHYGSGNIPSLQRQYIEKGAVWLSICSSAEGKQGYIAGDALKQRMKKEGWNATAYLIDTSGTVGKMYEAKTTPHMYVINPDGALVYAGAIDAKPTTDAETTLESENYVKAAMAASMAGEEVGVKVSQPYGCSVKYAKK